MGGAGTVSSKPQGHRMSSSLRCPSLMAEAWLSVERRPQFCSLAVNQEIGPPFGGCGPWAPAAQADSCAPLPTVRVAGGSLGPAAAAVLPVVPAVQLRLPLQLLLPRGECVRRGALSPCPVPGAHQVPAWFRGPSLFRGAPLSLHSASFLGL